MRKPSPVLSAFAGVMLLCVYGCLFIGIRYVAPRVDQLENHLLDGLFLRAHPFPNDSDHLLLEVVSRQQLPKWRLLDLRSKTIQSLPALSRTTAFLGTTTTNQALFNLPLADLSTLYLGPPQYLPSGSEFYVAQTFEPSALDTDGQILSLNERATELLTNRYLSRLRFGKETALEWYDLESPQLGWRRTKLEWPNLKFSTGPNAIGKTPYFYCTFAEQKDLKKPFLDQLVVYEMTPNGPQVVNNRQSVRNQNHPLDSFICEMSLDGKSLDIRQPHDGDVVSSVPLKLPTSWAAADGDAASVAFAQEKSVNVENAYYWIDPKGVPITLGSSSWLLESDARQSIVRTGINPSPKFILKVDGKEDVVLDVPRVDRLIHLGFNDSDTIVALDYTFTVYKLSRETGKILSSFNPYFWPRLAALGTAVLALAWYFAWCRFSTSMGFTAWLDQLLLSILIVTTFAFRLNHPIDSDWLPCDWILATSFVWALLAAVTQGSFQFFHRPVIAAAITFAAACIPLVLLKLNSEELFSFADRVYYQLFAIRLTGIYLTLCLAFIVMKLMRRSKLQDPNNKLMTLTDLFLLTAIIAGVYAYLIREQRDEWAATLAPSMFLDHIPYIALSTAFILVTILVNRLRIAWYWIAMIFLSVTATCVLTGGSLRIGLEPRSPWFFATAMWAVYALGLISGCFLLLWPIFTRERRLAADGVTNPGTTSNDS